MHNWQLTTCAAMLDWTYAIVLLYVALWYTFAFCRHRVLLCTAVQLGASGGNDLVAAQLALTVTVSTATFISQIRHVCIHSTSIWDVWHHWQLQFDDCSIKSASTSVYRFFATLNLEICLTSTAVLQYMGLVWTPFVVHYHCCCTITALACT